MGEAHRQRVRIGRLGVDSVDFAGAVQAIIALATTQQAAYVVTPNADHVVRAEVDDSFVAIADAAALSVADGMPLVWAARFLGEHLPGRVTGADLLPALCGAAAEAGLTVYFLGGLPGEAALARDRLQRLHPQLKVAGLYSPPFGFELDEAECRRIVARINALAPHLVFVGVGSPKQERWIATWRSELKCGVLLGIGIAIAFAAGKVKRAPRLMQATGTEWLFRLLSEPRRLTGRYIHDLRFFAIVWRSRKRARKVL